MLEKPAGIILALVFLIPIIAIIGGIVVGILKVVGQQRQTELAQRERIAAIERGIDPSRLPPLVSPSASGEDPAAFLSSNERARRHSQGLIVAGILTLATGIGGTIFFSITEEQGNAWAIGIIPMCIAVGLLISGWLVRPRGNGSSSSRTT